MKRTSISTPSLGNIPKLLINSNKPSVLNSHDPKVQFFLGQLHLLNRDRQSALAQAKKLALVDTDDKVIQVGRK